jgi:hypothetical protein
MHLYDFTSETDKDGSKILRVHARIANRRSRDEQSEWIDFQFAIDVPTVRNGALLRAEALSKASEILRQLASDFQRLGQQR